MKKSGLSSTVPTIQEGRDLMRGHFAGVRAAVFCAAVLTGLIAVSSAFAVTVTSFTPTSGLPNKAGACPGGTIQITGTGFATDGGTVSVSFAGTATQAGGLQIGSDTTIYAVVPAGAATGPITVTTGKGSATTSGTFYVNPCPQEPLGGVGIGGGYEYGSTPTIYGISPSKGNVVTHVKITGISMNMVKAVYFGAVTAKAKYVLTSPTSIDAIVPAGAHSGPIGIAYSISASTSQGGTTPTNSAGNSHAAVALTWSSKKFTVTR
jgi:hypothetical protein